MSERRKIILHIGAGKTGSSAIQRFLSLNVDALRKEGVIVPSNNLKLAGKYYGNHVEKFRKWRENPDSGRTKLERAVAILFNEASDASTLLISAENLASYTKGPMLFEGLVQEYDIEAILYIRRQDEFILSAWQQWSSKVQKDFLAWLLSNIGVVGNWRACLANWNKVIPRDRMRVRIFDREMLEGRDVIADYFKLLGLSKPLEAFARPEKEANPSFADAVMDLVQGDQRFFRDAHDNRFQQFVNDVTGERYVKNSRESMLTPAQRRAIVAKYAVSNLWVQQAYFPDKTEGLFRPIQDDDYIQVDKKTTLQRQLSFIVSIVFGVYRWRKEPKKKSSKKEA